MSGRKEPRRDEDVDVAVDATLETDLGAVEHWIDVYLKDQSVEVRKKLLEELERLDEQIALSDAYRDSALGSAAFGYSSKGSVIGETSSVSAAEDVPGSVFWSQMVLITAAKRALAVQAPQTLADLRAANEALAAARGKQVD